MTRDTNGAHRLIENLAASSSREYDRSKRSTSIDSKRIDELNEKITLLVKENRETRKGVNMLEDVAEPIQYQGDLTYDVDQGHEVSYMGGQGYGQNGGFNQNYRNHPNLSYRSTNVANPQDQFYPPQQQQRYQPVQATQNQGFQRSFQQQQQPQRQFTPNNGFQGNYGQGVQQFQPRNNPQQQIANPLGEIKEMMQQLMATQQRDTAELQSKISDTKGCLEKSVAVFSAHLKILDERVAMHTEMFGVKNGQQQQDSKMRDPIPTKLDDPGRFELPIVIRGQKFQHSLCDLGASVNLMTKATAERLGFTKYTPTSMILEFADHSEKAPEGTLEDVEVKVGKTRVLADFVILDVNKEGVDPIILGRPFLCTTGATIDVRSGRINLHLKRDAKKDKPPDKTQDEEWSLKKKKRVTFAVPEIARRKGQEHVNREDDERKGPDIRDNKVNTAHTSMLSTKGEFKVRECSKKSETKRGPHQWGPTQWKGRGDLWETRCHPDPPWPDEQLSIPQNAFWAEIPEEFREWQPAQDTSYPTEAVTGQCPAFA